MYVRRFVRVVSELIVLVMLTLVFNGVVDNAAGFGRGDFSPLLRGTSDGASLGGPIPPTPPGGGEGLGPGAGGSGDSGDPDGSVNDTFVQPLNSTDGYANHTLSPFFVLDHATYTYVTSFG